MKKTNNPSNHVANTEKLKTKINKTEHNAEVAEEIIRETTDDRLKETLMEKNERRKESINAIRRELRQD